MSESLDRIEKRVVLRAARGKVWRALTRPEELGAWFGVRFEPGTIFAPGAVARGRITFPGYETWTFEVTVERLEPEQLFSWRWHPYPEPGVDVAAEPATLVEFRLAEAAGGTELTVVESGFERLSPARRVRAFPMNERGWAGQLENVARHVAG
ncbi:MAG TPA: SRPBCC family protein [Anaeromyxobacteraceae bacterium]|nr:SRPBCC family protein [Anaeromyxobacteraceae bacterium]